MPNWDRTHGSGAGAYLSTGGTQLYVRRARGGAAGWLLYVDGRLEGTAPGEAEAFAAAELVVRCVERTDPAGGEAAAA